jgi:hypothetical protein
VKIVIEGHEDAFEAACIKRLQKAASIMEQEEREG